MLRNLSAAQSPCHVKLGRLEAAAAAARLWPARAGRASCLASPRAGRKHSAARSLAIKSGWNPARRSRDQFHEPGPAGVAIPSHEVDL